ncbi:ataxin-10 isoform X2 [Pectinophora gossypiella]|uniref:ataxin-10 isoform X2 n=1 Tax=Pectinophora gossypiella TaxID=13191 RepID=UPI00214E1C20|nr:ataxin-10 isoform X2 [Pectinophora gossypiella]
MSRDKSVWFAEEILLDAKLINFQLETGEWDAVEEMLRAEAQLSKDAETGRLRPKKASEYTLRLIAEVLHIMRLDVEQASYNRSTLAVAEQCLRLVRSCAAAGTKMQTYISKELSILDSMLILATEYQHPSVELLNEEIQKKYESCMTVLVQTLGNLVVNNPFNQIMIWNKFDAIILNSLIGQNDKIASAAAMIVYNILLGQPNVLPEDVSLLNSLAYMYNNGNTEYPHLIIEYLIGVENTYIEKLYSKMEPESRMLVLNLAYNILMSTESQDINVSVNFVKFMAHEFKNKSDCILKTVDKYVNTIEPQEVVFLLDIIATASSMDAYMDCLQGDTSLFINCAFLLRAIHKLGKESSNFFSSLNKLYAATGKQLINDENMQAMVPTENPLTKNDSADNMLSCNETTSECTESESSEQYFECNENLNYLERLETINTIETLQQPLKFIEATPESRGNSAERTNVKIDNDLTKVAFKRSSSVPKGDDRVQPLPTRRISLEHKIDIGDDIEPPLIIDSTSPNGSMNTIAEVIPVGLHPRLELQGSSRTESQDSSPNDPPTEIHLSKEENKEVKASPSEISPPLSEVLNPETESQKQSPDAQKEVKKSQNLSTDFDLSEQLQKILGISAEKTRGDVEKKSEPAKEVKMSEETVTNKVPTVKIDSPEAQKTRLGAIDMTTSKKAVTSVETVERHVAFGFKASLVRTLGNLCWKNQENKRQIRELEVIPVLLDCCNIDARNPLIMQWVIFAVRNLCENCPENQEVISKMTLQGPVDNEVLQEMGLTLHTDAQGNSIKVAPLPRT